MKIFILFLLTCYMVQAQSLDQRVEDLERRLSLEEKRINFASKETIFTLGGRIQIDAAINTPSVNANGGSNTYDYYFTPKSFSDNAPLSKLSTQAKSSRLWFKTARQTSLGTLRSLIEVDFYGSNGNENVTNSHNLRLRHAYVTLDQFTIGQTNSTFMGNSLPDLILLSSDVVFIRQALLRYTLKSDNSSIDIAFENPETTLLDLDTNTSKAYNDDSFFDTVVRWRYESKSIQASLSLLLRSLDAENNRSRISKFSEGINGSLKYTFSNNDYIQTSFMTGEGVGRYIALGAYTAGEFDHKEIRNLTLCSGHLSYTHRFNPQLRSTLLASSVKSEPSQSFKFIQPESISSAHLNLRYAPLEQTLITLEYILGKREVRGSAEQRVNRTMASFSYIF